MEETIYDSTIEAWSHTHLHIQHDWQDPLVPNENSTAANKPRLKPTSHQHILQIQNQPRNPFVERNSVKYEPSWLVIPVISAILCCGFGGGDSLLIVDLDLELLFSYNIVVKIAWSRSEGKMCVREGERGALVNWRWWYGRFNSGLKSA